MVHVNECQHVLCDVAPVYMFHWILKVLSVPTAGGFRIALEPEPEVSKHKQSPALPLCAD